MRLVANHVMAALVGLSLVGSLGCSSTDGYAPLPRPKKSDTSLITPTTPAPDYEAVELSRAQGTTTTTSLVLSPGSARLAGSVVGPNGPVPNATVVLERLVGDSVASGIVSTGVDGTWEAANILGGRYRIRAWLAPEFAQLEPQLLFVPGNSDGSAPVELKMEKISKIIAEAAISPSPPVVNQSANLVVRLSLRSIDKDGLLRSVPQDFASWRLVATGRWTIQSATVSSDSGGRASYRITCGAVGAQALTVVFNGETLPLSLPECASG